MTNTINILLVEDDPADSDLIRESMNEAKLMVTLSVVDDGVKALQFLRREGDYEDTVRPDLILLDLNLPKKDGREVLAEIRGDDALKTIPIVVLTTSDDDEDILKCYGLGANCYVTKPVGFEEFSKIVCQIEEFWFTVVKLPPPQ